MGFPITLFERFACVFLDQSVKCIALQLNSSGLDFGEVVCGKVCKSSGKAFPQADVARVTVELIEDLDLLFGWIAFKVFLRADLDAVEVLGQAFTRQIRVVCLDRVQN